MGHLEPRLGLEVPGAGFGSDAQSRPVWATFRLNAGGSDEVVSGVFGRGVALTVAESVTSFGSFDRTHDTEDAWRASGSLGLTIAF